MYARRIVASEAGTSRFETSRRVRLLVSVVVNRALPLRAKVADPPDDLVRHAVDVHALPILHPIREEAGPEVRVVTQAPDGGEHAAGVAGRHEQQIVTVPEHGGDRPDGRR